MVLLLRSLALLLPREDLRLFILNRLVNLGALRRLISMHLGRQGGIVLPSDLLGRLLLAAALGGVVLVFGSRKAVGYTALILCVAELARDIYAQLNPASSKRLHRNGSY